MTGQPSNSKVVTRVGSLLRGISVHEPEGVSTSDIARAVGLARPTAHRLLSSLAEEGLVDRDSRSGAWHLGPELYLLGKPARGRYDITEDARDLVRDLSQSTGESAFLSARRGDETVCLLRTDGSFPLRSHVLYEGVRFPLGVASAGLAILAHLPARDANSYLDRIDLESKWGSAHSGSAIRARILRTRTDGYATNPALIVEGSWGMAAAVFDEDSRPEWALSLTGVESRFGLDRRQELGRVLLEKAHELSTAIGSRPARR